MRRVRRQRVLAPAAVLVVAWPLLLASGPGRWCPTKPSPSPSVTKTVAPVKPTSPPQAPKPAAVLPPPPSPSYSPPPPKIVPRPVKRHPAPKPRPTIAFVARGNLVPPTPGSQHKNLPLPLLVVVVLAPCVAAAVTRYVKLR